MKQGQVRALGTIVVAASLLATAGCSGTAGSSASQAPPQPVSLAEANKIYDAYLADLKAASARAYAKPYDASGFAKIAGPALTKKYEVLTKRAAVEKKARNDPAPHPFISAATEGTQTWPQSLVIIAGNRPAANKFTVRMELAKRLAKRKIALPSQGAKKEGDKSEFTYLTLERKDANSPWIATNEIDEALALVPRSLVVKDNATLSEAESKRIDTALKDLPRALAGEKVPGFGAYVASIGSGIGQFWNDKTPKGARTVNRFDVVSGPKLVAQGGDAVALGTVDGLALLVSLDGEHTISADKPVLRYSGGYDKIYNQPGKFSKIQWRTVSSMMIEFTAKSASSTAVRYLPVL